MLLSDCSTHCQNVIETLSRKPNNVSHFTTYYLFCATDDEKPVFANCSSDIYVNTSIGSNMEVVNWTPPKATDNSGMVVVTQNVPDGAFSIGETSITYIAADAANNVERCMFFIFVSGMLKIKM